MELLSSRYKTTLDGKKVSPLASPVRVLLSRGQGAPPPSFFNSSKMLTCCRTLILIYDGELVRSRRSCQGRRSVGITCNYHTPVLTFQTDVFQKVIFTLFGVYFWELFMTWDFEWSLITKRRKFRWPLVSLFYELTPRCLFYFAGYAF